MRFRLIYSSWLNLAKLKLKAPRAFLKMKRQDLILKKKTELTKLTELLGALPDLPKSLTICEYSSHHGIDIDGVTTLEKALEIVKEFKRNLLLPAHELNYYGLSKEWNSKTYKYTEVLRVTYKVGRHEDLDAYDTPSIKFSVRNPAKTLKALGVKCRIKTVRKEARIVEARETREVVCPLSA